MRDLRASRDQSREGRFWSILGSILGSILAISRPYLGNLIITSGIAFIWPWVGTLRLNMVNLGSGGLGGSTRYSTPPDPPSSHTPGTPPPTPCTPGYAAALLAHRSNMVVGLRSVDQLTLVAHISRSGTITEVYNLSVAGRNNNHLSIPGNK